jgi:anti-anti-sigma factor
MSSFDLEHREDADGRAVLVTVSGELDLTNASEVEERLDGLSRPDAVHVLDLTRVVFLDSAALHVLFRVTERLGRDRVGLVVAPTSPIARTLEIVGLTRTTVTGQTPAAVLEALERSS